MTHRRPAFMLVVVLMLAALAATIVAALAAVNLNAHRLRNVDQLEATARCVLSSALTFARHRRSDWREVRPEGAIELDVNALLGPRMTGKAVIEFLPGEGGGSYRISASVERRGYRVKEQATEPIAG